MEIGSRTTLDIQDLAFGGDGVGRTESCVVFVPFAAVGDQLVVEITELHRNFARGRIQEILRPSPNRTEPACPHYGKCGGCQYQHLDYQAEFQAKQKQLRDLLQRIGGLSQAPELDCAIPAPEIYGYRNKLRLEAKKLPVAQGESPQVDYGYYALDNQTFLRINGCRLADPRLNKAIPTALKSDWGKANARRRKPLQPAPLTLRIDTQGEIKFYFGFAPRCLGWFKEELAGVPFRVPAGSFWQVNPKMASALLETVDGWVKDLPAETLVDAYCGAGTFSCALSRPYKERLLMENDAAATEAAQYNLQQLMKGCQILTEATEKALPKRLPKYNPAETLVVLDPPRAGCQARVLQCLKECRPAWILYVSCNPSTLSRDLKTLLKDGSYQIQKIGLFDMFPRTAHFETAVLLRG